MLAEPLAHFLPVETLSGAVTKLLLRFTMQPRVAVPSQNVKKQNCHLILAGVDLASFNQVD